MRVTLLLPRGKTCEAFMVTSTSAAICHCRKEREKEWKEEILKFREKYFPLKHGRHFLFGKKERKSNTFSARPVLVKRLELVIAVAQEHRLNSGYSCLNAALKLS